jgi:REP element-mobilizing transposase RayT
MGQARRQAEEVEGSVENRSRRYQTGSLLIREPAKGTPSTVMQVWKQRVAQRLHRKPRISMTCRQLQLPFRDVHDFLAQFWQPRFHDFNLRSQKKFVEKLRYMHLNPVKRRRVSHPKDWLWSSFSFYARKENGLVRIDPVR